MGIEDLSRLLKELRGDRPLREVAERAGISHTYLNQLEMGKDKRTGKPIKPTPDTLRRLSAAYNFSYEKLMAVAGYADQTQEHDPGITPRDQIKTFQSKIRPENIDKINELGPDSLEILEQQIQLLWRLEKEGPKRDKK